MNEVIKCLKERRSIKKYKSTPINPADLDTILECGTYAPSGRNRQASVMVAVTDKETVKLLSKLNAEIMGMPDIDPFYNAPCVVIVFADSDVHTYIEDGSLVIGNLLNATHSLGLGGCWIHRAREMFETEIGKELMKKWGLSENYKGIGNCIIGYAESDTLPIATERKSNYIIKA